MKKKFQLVALVLAAIVMSSCGDSKKQEIKETKQTPIAEHVILIGCDGFGAYAYEKGNMPNLKKLASEGSYTLKTRSVLPSSSAVNWASMLMGSTPSQHGYTEWGSQTPEIPSRVLSQYGKYPSIFTLMKEQRVADKSVAVYSWGGIGYLIEDQAVTFNVPTEGDDQVAADKLCKLIMDEKPTLTFVHFDGIDHVGHSIGHNTPEYYKSLEVVDGYIGQIVEAVKAAGIENGTVIMVASDHGGIDQGHGGKTLEEVETPFIIKGKGIKAGYEIKDVMMVYDIAPTMAKVLGLKLPQTWRGHAIGEAFVK